MNIKIVLIGLVLLAASVLSGCAGYAVYGYNDYPYYYDYGYPYGYFSFHQDFDHFHHFRGGGHFGRHFSGRFEGGHRERGRS